MGLFSLSLFTSKKKVANHSLLPIRVRPEIIPAQCQLQLDGHGRPTTAPTVPPISTCEAARSRLNLLLICPQFQNSINASDLKRANYQGRVQSRCCWSRMWSIDNSKTYYRTAGERFICPKSPRSF